MVDYRSQIAECFDQFRGHRWLSSVAAQFSNFGALGNNSGFHIVQSGFDISLEFVELCSQAIRQSLDGIESPVKFAEIRQNFVLRRNGRVITQRATDHA